MAVTEEIKIKKKRYRKSKKLKTISFDAETVTKEDIEKLPKVTETVNKTENTSKSKEDEIHENPKPKKKKKRANSDTNTTNEVETKKKKIKNISNNLNSNNVTNTNKDNIEEKSELNTIESSSNNDTNLNDEKPEKSQNTISNRELKRQRKAKLLEEKRAESERTLQKKALNYLSLWKHNRSDWKFEKLRQIWLQQHMFDCKKIPNEHWNTLVEYLSNSRGKSKDVIMKEAIKVVEAEETRKTEDNDNTKLVRARDILQNLQES